MIKVNKIEKKYDFITFVEQIDTILKVQRTDSYRKALFVDNKEVASIWIKGESCPTNNINILDEQYLDEVLRVLKLWKKYYGFRKMITVDIMPKEVKPIK